MKRVFLLILCLALFPLSGCAVKKDWMATGGSRSDATVELSYEYHEFEMPQVDDAQGLELARQRCRSWGYADAEPFGGIRKSQNSSSSWMVTKQYQCLGQGTETSRKRK